MTRSGSRRRPPINEINVVPYIDVMLVLMIIFMVTAPLLQTGVEVDLPNAESEPLDNGQQEVTLVLTVQKDGAFLFGDKAMDSDRQLMEAVSAILRLAQKNGRQPQVLVAGDQGVNYGRVVEGMALLQAAGVPQVGLITESVQ